MMELHDQLLLEALQKVAKLVEERILPAHLPGSSLRKRKWFPNCMQNAIDASKAASVTNSAIHDVADCVLINKTVFVESQAAGLGRVDVLFACRFFEKYVCTISCVGAVAARCQPNPTWLEWVYTEVVELWIEVWEGTLKIKATNSFYIGRLRKRADHRSRKLEILCQHLWFRSTLVVSQKHLGHLNELLWCYVEAGLCQFCSLINDTTSFEFSESLIFNYSAGSCPSQSRFVN